MAPVSLWRSEEVPPLGVALPQVLSDVPRNRSRCFGQHFFVSNCGGSNEASCTMDCGRSRNGGG